MGDEHRISIWFFIGSLLTVYGVIILIASLPALFGGAQPDVVLANLHAGTWWGALLIALGLMYVIVFWPWKDESDETS